MNNTTAWAVLSKSVLRLLHTKQLGFELLSKHTVLELHMSKDLTDNFPVFYELHNQMTLKRDLSQLDKELTLRIRHRFHCLLVDCLVLSETSGYKILRVGGHYGYFQCQGSMIEFLERLQHELGMSLPEFDEKDAADFFATYDSMIALFFTADSKREGIGAKPQPYSSSESDGRSVLDMKVLS